MTTYFLSFNSDGKFECANVIGSGATVPYFPLNPSCSELNHPLTIEFLAAVDAGEVDISDREPDPVIYYPDWNVLKGLGDGSSNPLFLLLSAVYQDPSMLINGVQQLSGLLTLTPEQKTEWNNAIDSAHFPVECKVAE